MDLANDNLNNYNEILKFCKDMINETLEKPIVNIIGNGLNGKSTLMRVIHMLMSHKIEKIPKFGLSQSFFSNLYSDNLRYIEISDVDNKDIAKMFGNMKSIVAGEDMQIRKLYARSITTVKPNIKFIIVSNGIFNTNGDAGINRRTKIIKMEAIFDNLHKTPNPNIFEELLMHRVPLEKFILNYETMNYNEITEIDNVICINISI